MYVEMRRGEKDMEYKRAQTYIIQNHLRSAGTSKKNFPSNGVPSNIPVLLPHICTIVRTVYKIEGNSQRGYILTYIHT